MKHQILRMVMNQFIMLKKHADHTAFMQMGLGTQSPMLPNSFLVILNIMLQPRK